MKMNSRSNFKALQKREIGTNRCFRMRRTHENFWSISLQEEYNTQIPKGQSAMVLPFLRGQTKVVEIVSARGVVFALLESGVCAAFSRETNRRICFLHMSSGEVIRSLFYNKYNDSVITVSVSESDDFSSLKCRTTRIEYIQRGQPDAGFTLFQSESLKWPGYVEFDDVNVKALTYSAEESIYKVFDLRNYTMLYSISDKDVKEIKISPGTMLFIYTRSTNYIHLKILSIEDGSVLKSFNYLLHRERKVELIEQFNEKLLVKQENENLQILDMFLTFRNQTVAMWNFRGELVTVFEDHLLWHPDSNINTICITTDQDLIISYGKVDSNDQQQNAGSINISSILSGKCVAKIDAGNTHLLEECNCSGRRCNLNRQIQATDVTSTVAQALNDVTAIFYDEELNEIYTGNHAGLLHVWSS